MESRSKKMYVNVGKISVYEHYTVHNVCRMYMRHEYYDKFGPTDSVMWFYLYKDGQLQITDKRLLSVLEDRWQQCSKVGKESLAKQIEKEKKEEFLNNVN